MLGVVHGEDRVPGLIHVTRGEVPVRRGPDARPIQDLANIGVPRDQPGLVLGIPVNRVVGAQRRQPLVFPVQSQARVVDVVIHGRSPLGA